MFIIGASGHGKVIANIASYAYDKIYFLDDDISMYDKCISMGKRKIPVIGDSSYAIKYKNEADAIVAIGNCKIRERILKLLIKNNVSIATLIHPTAVIAEDVSIGIGTVVMGNAVINSGTIVGNGVIVNTGATIDHDNNIKNFVHIAVGSHIAGSVIIDERTWVGAGTVVSNNLNICSDCMIGAGAAVISDINEKGTYVGVPVKRIK